MSPSGKYIDQMTDSLLSAIKNETTIHIDLAIAFHKQLFPSDNSSKYWLALHGLELRIYYSQISDEDPYIPFRYEMNGKRYVRFSYGRVWV